MKAGVKILVQKILALLVAIKLRRTRPEIIGITGSFGKTSTKEALYHVLKSRFHVYRNPKSLNTEIGLLLAVLEQPSGFSNPLAWLVIMCRATWNAFAGRRYDVLILEYGADRPGDIQHLVSLVKPHIAIITGIARTHQAEGQFKNEEEVFNEKKKLVTCLGLSEKVILNYDDSWLKKLGPPGVKAKIFWYGNTLHTKGDIQYFNLKNTKTGFEADIKSGDEKNHAEFQIAGSYHINIILPALMCGMLHGIPLKEGIAVLKDFKLPPGRMSIIPGKNGTLLLDSTYNASPETTKAALMLLRDFPGKRKIAVLGNMNELGNHTEIAHLEIAQGLGTWLDMLITVGQFAKITAAEALKRGLPESRIKILNSAEEAAELLRKLPLQKDDVILFKGSQNNVRLERAIKMLMAYPEHAAHVLCRQEKEWQSIQ